MKIIPMTIRDANEFVQNVHRHHGKTAGGKFAIGVTDDDMQIHGVAIAGRPVSRVLDDGFTLEINRCCTDGMRNACSALYGACIRIARNMGYRRVITYTLQSENGASVKAANFRFDGIAGAAQWTGKRSGRDNGVPREQKKKWVYDLMGGNENG